MNSKNHVLCIYHDHCADGLAAAWVVREACKNIICNTVAMSYGQELPIHDIAEAGIVYIVDFSIGAEKLLDLCRVFPNISFKWIDHHKTAVEEWDKLLAGYAVPRNLDVCLSRNNTAAGSLLTWQYMHHEPAPWWIQCISDRDIWKFESPSSKPLHAWLVHRGLTFNTLDILATVPWDGVERAAIIHEGELLLAHFLRLCHDIVDCTKEEVTIAGYKGLSCNAPPMFASDIGNILAEESGTYGLVWYSPRASEVHCSLRSVVGTDVSAMAQMFGGGGHARAAGFKLTNQSIGAGVSIWNTEENIDGRHSDVSGGDTTATTGNTEASSGVDAAT